LSQPIVGAAQGEKGPITTLAASQASGAKRGRKPQSRTLSKEDLEEFKTAVVGSDIGKVELAKALKARYVRTFFHSTFALQDSMCTPPNFLNDRFPKMTHDTIKETLSERFAQVGSKGEKKWIFVEAL